MPAVLSELTFTDSEDDISTIKISTTCGGGHMSWWAGGCEYLAHMTRLKYDSGSGCLMAPENDQLMATLVKPAVGPERDALIMGLVHMAKSAGDVTLEGFPGVSDVPGSGKCHAIRKCESAVHVSHAREDELNPCVAFVVLHG